MTDEAVAYLDAIRLARSLAASDVALKPVVDELLERAPTGEGDDGQAPRLLVHAIGERNVTFGTYTRYRRPPTLSTWIVVGMIVGLFLYVVIWRV